MLEEKEYLFTEISELLQTFDNTDIKKKLDRYGVEYECVGRGRQIKFHIKNIPDRFKLFCITEWGMPAQIDFRKLRIFLYYFLCDDEFSELPTEEMERRLSDSEAPVSRQTIAKWIERMRQMGLFEYSKTDFVYYKVSKINGVQMQEYISQEEYRKAWQIYWAEKNKHNDSNIAFMAMYRVLGGVPKKKPKYEWNVFFYKTKVEPMIDLISEDLLIETLMGEGE